MSARLTAGTPEPAPTSGMLARMLRSFAINVSVIVVILLAGRYFVLLPTVETIERNVVTREMDRLANVIDDQTVQLSRKTRDSAYWDQPWYLLRDGVGELWDILPTIENFRNTAVNVVLYVRTDDSIYWQQSWDTDYAAPLVFKDIEPALSPRLIAVTRFGDEPPEAAEHRGFLATEHGILMLAARPIRKSNMTGQRMGTLLYGRLMVRGNLENLRKVTGTHVTLMTFDDLPQDVRNGLRQQPTLWIARKGPNLQGYRIINDIDGKPTLVLMTDVPAREFAAVLTALDNNLALLGVCIIGMLAVLALAINLRILQPVTRLSTRLSALTAQDDFSRPIPVLTDDETGRLTASVNALLQRAAGLKQMLRENEHITLTNRELEQEVAARTAEIEANTAAMLQAQQALILEERKASLNVFTAGIAHEINNPVNFLHASAQTCEARATRFRDLLLDLLPEEETDTRAGIRQRFDDILRLLSAVLEDTARINNTVKGLRTVSHLHQEDREALDVVNTLDHALTLVQARAGQHVDIVRHFDSHLPVNAWGSEINQAFMNIILNAIAAMEDRYPAGGATRGTLRVSSREESGRLVITLEDNGIGADARVIARAFEPFFTTRSHKGASGLGLSIARDILHRHGGTLQLRSAPGQGTTVTLTLPSADARPDEPMTGTGGGA